jgi:hypothetical protein
MASTQTDRRIAAIASIAIVLALAARDAAVAQTVDVASKSSTGREAVSVEGLAVLGVQWPAAVQTFEATKLDARPLEFGGGVQVTNLWRELFAQATVARTSNTGERIFVDSDGVVFPLGIPLSITATYVDVSAGWKLRSPARRAVVPYLAGGFGLVQYKETSPFAEAGDDVEESTVSYHVQGGVEVGILKWFGLSADFRYRRVPDLLGGGGVSAAFGEDDFGGFNATLGLHVKFPSRTSVPATPDQPARDAPNQPPVTIPGAIDRDVDSSSAVTVARAPVYLRMDTGLEPLRTLEAGTSVKVLAELESWVRIEFYDRLLGSRVGYIERKHLRVSKL